MLLPHVSKPCKILYAQCSSAVNWCPGSPGHPSAILAVLFAHGKCCDPGSSSIRLHVEACEFARCVQPQKHMELVQRCWCKGGGKFATLLYPSVHWSQYMTRTASHWLAGWSPCWLAGHHGQAGRLATGAYSESISRMHRHPGRGSSAGSPTGCLPACPFDIGFADFAFGTPATALLLIPAIFPAACICADLDIASAPRGARSSWIWHFAVGGFLFHNGHFMCYWNNQPRARASCGSCLLHGPRPRSRLGVHLFPPAKPCGFVPPAHAGTGGRALAAGPALPWLRARGLGSQRKTHCPWPVAASQFCT